MSDTDVPGIVLTMPDKPDKRGPGRPPLNDKGGITRPVTVRLSDKNLETAGKVIAEGHATNVSDAIRWVMDRYEDESGKK